MKGLDSPISNAYKLNEDKSISKVHTLREYASCFDDNKTRIKSTTIKINSIECRVSTIFLVLDHSYGEGVDPLLFETMIFQKDKTSPNGKSRELNYQARCHTYQGALKQHQEAVEYLKTLELEKTITIVD